MIDSTLTAEERYARLSQSQQAKWTKLMLERYRSIVVFAQAVVAGRARWEPFPDMSDKGEVYVDGMRYSTTLEDGLPLIEGPLLAALENVTKEFHRV